MSDFQSGWGRSVVSILGLFLFATIAQSASADFVVTKSTGSDQLTLRNLVGEVVVEGHGGSDFEIEVAVQGADADPDRLRVELVEGSSEAELNIRFPLDESRSFVYPRMGRSSSKFRMDRNDGGRRLSKMYDGMSKKKITISGRGSGLELWADVTVRVPAGASFRLYHGVGDIDAGGVEAELELDSMSGSVDVSRIHGSLLVDVGSGAVSVEDVQGDEVIVDTGSGSVELTDCLSEMVNVDTGSGQVEIENARGKKLLVDTGSGAVRAREIDMESASIDTGSGEVRLELSGMGSGRFEIDTGSGGIDLHLPANASAEIRADTGSGGIRVDVDGGAQVQHQDDDSAVIVVGGGAADVRLDTGSGSIRIRG